MRAVLIASLLLAAPGHGGAARPTPCRRRPPPSRPGLISTSCSRIARAATAPDYISTQPRHLPNPQAFWQAEVTKMKGLYGAPIDAEDVPKIVDYLVQTYGQ